MRVVDSRVRLSASDLVNHLACRHLTRLDFGVASGEIESPDFRDPVVEMLQQKGDAHEKAYIAHLRETGHQVTSIGGLGLDDADVAETIQAMREGHEIIVQGSFVQGGWGGRADILRRVPVSSALGDWSYEVIDTKLAQQTKAGTILQLSLYSELVGEVQGTLPEFMYVVTPWTEFEPQRFRTNDYSAYYRLIKRRLESYFETDKPAETYPDPRDHCRICRWREHCDGVRRDDDHISLVAGISESQVAELRDRGIVRTTDLASLSFPLPWVARSATADRFRKLREQARVQVTSRVSGPVCEPLSQEKPETGLEGLPAPSAGDAFFAFERAPFVGPNGVNYLLGVLPASESWGAGYNCFWAMSADEEKRAFELFVDLVCEKWKRDPAMHVYHYGRSGSNALTRLSGRYGTREAEIETMLRMGLFVDLYPIVREGVLASVERYSLEELEPFYRFVRTVSRDSAEEAARNISSAMELAYPGEVGDVTDDDKETVRVYNADNCRSVYGLRGWLEGLRDELAAASGKGVARPVPERYGGAAPETEMRELVRLLQEGIPAEQSRRTSEQEARWILSNILNWHWKEEIAAREEFARLADCSSEELLDENRALAQLERIDAIDYSVHRYRFPAQETSLANEDDLYGQGGARIGKVESLDFPNREVDIRGQRGEDFVRGDVIGFADIPTNALKESLKTLGRRATQRRANGGGKFNLGWELLTRNQPRTGGGSVCGPSETAEDAALRACRDAEFGVLPVQGPPGSGKTRLGARMICELFRQGFRVGITANSHRVIRNLVDTTLEVAAEQHLDLRAVHRVSRPDDGPQAPRLLVTGSYRSVLGRLDAERSVAAGTAWMWSRDDFQGAVDVLFVDEAAQMSLANVLASCQAARNLVLLGDPQQLDQPVRGNHPEGVDVSALGFILQGKATIGEYEGLFLPNTFRLHPEICSFTSESFYEGRLESLPGLELQRVVSSGPLSGSGLRYVSVEHRGNRTSSLEEVETVARLVSSLANGSSVWVDREGRKNPIRWQDVLIIAPYNAQVQRIQERLPDANVGTVDKFQGQEAPVVIYSMATSNPSEAPRGMDFLYNLNRLNVATSRARCICVLVGSPALFEPDCRTPGEMRLANALCRYRKLATEIRI